MMDSLFIKIVNMSITSGFVIIFIIIARLFLKRVPKIFAYALWSAALFRLICPFSVESMLSIIPINSESVSKDIIYAKVPQINMGITSIDNAVNAYLPEGTPQASVNPLQIWTLIGESIWIIGIAVILLYGLISYAKLKNRLKNAVNEKGNIYVCKSIETPFVLGLIRPKIYLPASLGIYEKEYILLHEQTHIKRLDHVVRILSFLVLCIHWFNPLVWVVFFLSGKDMEMSCDEAVIKRLGSEVKSEYSSSLLALATGRRILGATPLAFGEGETKGRVKNVLRYKKPSFWVIVAAVIVCSAIAFSLMTNPKTPQKVSDDTNNINDINTMDIAISKAINEQNTNRDSDFAAESHVILGTEAGGPADGNIVDTVTVFAMAMNMEFDYSGGWFEETGGSHMPVAISFDVNEKEEYLLKEYWMPMDGAGYGPSIKEKFPSGLYEDAIYTQKYVRGQIMDCYDDAINYWEIGQSDVGNRIEELLEIIMSSPMGNSNPQAYIDEHHIEYREIVFIGRHAIDYCFSEFDKGNETGLKGHIMASACCDIMAVYGEEFEDNFNTGQEWYDAYMNLVSQKEDN
ncbi:MAG: M56 family metallopeptidase [Peptostreptococcaceae bacterium]|nr:M56 family metallopeptidase [Peptostreptococcaceae bacterium]